MQSSQTLLAYSVEEFLLPEEIRSIARSMQRFMESEDRDFRAGADSRSVHRIDGRDTAEAVAVYEPAGRIEVTDVPPEVIAILDDAFARTLPRIRRAYPSVSKRDCWIYLEYGVDQHITAHADYAENEDRPDQPKIAGLSIVLNDDFEGGEFFIETTASSDIWQPEGGDRIVPGANESSDWFRSMPRTRWVARPKAGTALMYGSQLIHGTTPIRSGRARKIIGFVTA